MDEKQIEELARQLADDIASGKEIRTQATVPAQFTEKDLQAIMDHFYPFKVDYRLYMGIDWGRGRDRTDYFFPSA